MIGRSNNSNNFGFRVSTGVRGMTTNRISRHGWLLAVAGLIIASLVFTLTPGSPAQAPKTKDKAKDKDKTGAKKEPKIEPPPTTFPKRIDFIDPAQGGTQHVNLI